MQILGDAQSLSEAMAFVARRCPPHSPDPVRGGLRLHASGAELTMSAYDLEAAAAATVPASVKTPGEVLVPGRVCAEIIRSLPAGQVELRRSARGVEITAAAVEFELPCLPLADVPTAPRPGEPIGTVDGRDLRSCVAGVARAAARDDVVPVLSGIRLTWSAEGVTACATDRYRVAIDGVAWQRHGTGEGEVVAPARALLDAVKAADGSSVSIGVSRSTPGEAGSVLTIAGAMRSTTLRLLDNQFPAVQRYVPDRTDGSVTVDTAALADAVRRVALVADPSSRAAGVSMQMHIDDGVVVSAGDDTDRRGRERVDARVDGPPTVLTVSAGYLLDGLTGIDDDLVTIGFFEGFRPLLVTGSGPGGLRYVVQPRRPRAQ